MGSYRHPFVVNLSRSAYPLKKITLSRVMILATTVPSIIHQFMIIPNAYEWVALVQQLQVNISAI